MDSIVNFTILKKQFDKIYACFFKMILVLNVTNVLEPVPASPFSELQSNALQAYS